MKARVILVTGSREWTDESQISARLAVHRDAAAHARCDLILLHGDCVGADRLAVQAAGKARRDAVSVEIIRIPGWWHLGKAGGMRRNVALVETACAFRHAGHEVFVEAFPMKGGKGTQGCIKLARDRGLTVRVTGEE